jgi:P-type Cu2+ transporter
MSAHAHPAHPDPPAHGGHDSRAGHDKHAGHSVAMFRDRFWLTLLLTIPTVIWSEMIQHWFGYTAPRFPGSQYMPAIFGMIVYFYGDWPFLQGAYRELRDRLPGRR